MESLPWHDIQYWERAFVDLWTVTHVISGQALALIPVLAQLSLGWAFAAVAALAALWEAGEVAFGIEEATTNRLTDIVAALVGFAIALPLLNKKRFGEKRTMVVRGVIVVALLAATLVSWVAYKEYSGA